MAAPKIAVIIPVYEKYLYALRAVESCFNYTENVLVIVEDAYSPYFKAPMFEEAKYIGKGSEVFIHRFPKHGDLTRSCNHGLRVARKKGVDYCVCGNIDIVFTKWLSNGLIHALNHGYDLVGPVSNAPGTTCPKGKAQIDKYYENYQVTDDPEYLNEVSVTLQ